MLPTLYFFWDGFSGVEILGPSIDFSRRVTYDVSSRARPSGDIHRSVDCVDIHRRVRSPDR